MLEPAFGVLAHQPSVSVPALLVAVSGAAILAAVLEAAVDAPARPVGTAVSDPAAYGV